MIIIYLLIATGLVYVIAEIASCHEIERQIALDDMLFKIKLRGRIAKRNECKLYMMRGLQ